MKCIRCDNIELEGRKRVCDNCQRLVHNEYNKKWANNHKELIKERDISYRDKRKDKKKVEDRIYYEKNKIKIAEYKKQWAQNNTEKIKEYAIQKYKTNKQKHYIRIMAHRIAIPEEQLCELCKEQLAVDRHHPDYSKPFEIVYVCKSCHGKIHMKYMLIKENNEWRLIENDLSIFPIQ